MFVYVHRICVKLSIYVLEVRISATCELGEGENFWWKFWNQIRPHIRPVFGRIVDGFWKKIISLLPWIRPGIEPEIQPDSGRIVMWHRRQPTLTSCFPPYLSCFGCICSSFFPSLPGCLGEKTREEKMWEPHLTLRWTKGFARLPAQLSPGLRIWNKRKPYQPLKRTSRI